MKNKFSKRVDLVYTWVDGTDIEWQKKKASIESKNKPEYEANIPCRYRNNDELRYSLRSVEKYVPWINNIYIITDNQTPKWLNLNNPKIKIIDHSEIIPKSALPTFNSIAIEYCMHNIPNLSEYFLYSNDDTYFGDYVTEDFFFTKDGKPICRFGPDADSIGDDSLLYKNIIFNSINILKSKNYIFKPKKSHHGIDAYKKSIITDCQNEFKEEFEATINSPFRTSNNIERVIYLYYAVATKRGKYKKNYKVELNQPPLKRFFKSLFKGSINDSLCIVHSNENLTVEQRFNQIKPKIFCINDNKFVTEEELKDANEFLKKMFPDKSSFEK